MLYLQKLYSGIKKLCNKIYSYYLSVFSFTPEFIDFPFKVLNLIVLAATAYILLLTYQTQKDIIEVSNRNLVFQDKANRQQQDMIKISTKNLELQNQILLNQVYISEIETRPYLNMGIKDIKFKELNEKDDSLTFTVDFINNGKVPARNIKFSGNYHGYEMEERNFDLISGSKIDFALSLGATKPLTDINLYLYAAYDGMKKSQKRYKILIAGTIKRQEDKGYFDPVAIKIDDDAMAWQFAFEEMNKGKPESGYRWPKLRAVPP